MSDFVSVNDGEFMSQAEMEAEARCEACGACTGENEDIVEEMGKRMAERLESFPETSQTLVSSEFVSPAHPDRLADLIAASIIDYVGLGGNGDLSGVHAAIEVFLGCSNGRPVVVVGGEVNSDSDLLTDNGRFIVLSIVKRVMHQVGYRASLREVGFTRDDVIIGDDIEAGDIVMALNSQSEDIHQGVSVDRGWNDNGIFFGYADSSNVSRLGYAHWVAGIVSRYLWLRALNFDPDEVPVARLGPDNKVLVIADKSNVIHKIVVSVPTLDSNKNGALGESVREYLFSKGIDVRRAQIEINTSGGFVRHGFLADSGLTGRKLAVNTYGGYGRIGGGSMVKCWHAADSMLAFLARHLALIFLEAATAGGRFPPLSCEVSLSCAIGQDNINGFDIRLDPLDGGDTTDRARLRGMATAVRSRVMRDIQKGELKVSPRMLVDLFPVHKAGDFAQVVLDNFFGAIELADYESKPWEDIGRDSPFRKYLSSIRLY